MHELAATESVMNLAIRAARENGASRVKGITVEIGRYSGILQEYMSKYFEVASLGTIAEGAVLMYTEEPVMMHCNDCGADSRIDPDAMALCPKCGSPDFRLTQGWDVRVVNVEVE